jgi:hypothetical protein
MHVGRGASPCSTDYRYVVSSRRSRRWRPDCPPHNLIQEQGIPQVSVIATKSGSQRQPGHPYITPYDHELCSRKHCREEGRPGTKGIVWVTAAVAPNKPHHIDLAGQTWSPRRCCHQPHRKGEHRSRKQTVAQRP